MGFNDALGNYHEFRACIPISLHSWREADANGDVGAIAANGGILASDTTPIMRGASGLISQEISWAASNADPIVCQVPLPDDFSGKDDVLLKARVYSGTTNAASFTIGTSWDGGATVSDTGTGQASATIHEVVVTIAAADIPDNASFVTILLTPAAHGTDALQLCSTKLCYVPKVKA